MPISPQATILPFQGVSPQIDDAAFIGPNVTIIGDVKIGAETSVWPGCVIRGDEMPIRIGSHTNIQDGSVLHVTDGKKGTYVGDYVTVGHMSLLHECEVETRGFIGMRATLLDGSKVEGGGMLAAGALLTQDKIVPSGQIWAGNPAKYWRDISEDQKASFKSSPHEYVELAKKQSW